MEAIEKFLKEKTPEEALRTLLSSHSVPVEILREYPLRVGWDALSINPYLAWSAELIKEFGLFWNWISLGVNGGIPLSDEVMKLMTRNELLDKLKSRDAKLKDKKRPQFSEEEVGAALRRLLPIEKEWFKVDFSRRGTSPNTLKLKWKKPPSEFINAETGELLYEDGLICTITSSKKYGLYDDCPFGEVILLNDSLKKLGIKAGLLCSPKAKLVFSAFRLPPHHWVPCTANGVECWLLYLLTEGEGDPEGFREMKKGVFRVNLLDAKLKRTATDDFYERGVIQSQEQIEEETKKWEAKYPGKTVALIGENDYNVDFDLFRANDQDWTASRPLLEALLVAGIWQGQGVKAKGSVVCPHTLTEEATMRLKRVQKAALVRVRKSFPKKPLALDSLPAIEARRLASKKKAKEEKGVELEKEVEVEREHLVNLRNNPDKPDFMAQLREVEKRKRFQFPEHYVQYIEWLQGVNTDATKIGEISEAILPGRFKKIKEHQLLDLESEVLEQTEFLRKKTGNYNYIAIAKEVKGGKTGNALLAYDVRSKKLFLCDKNEIEFNFPLRLWMGDIEVLNDFTRIENLNDVIFPTWYKFAQAQGTLVSRIKGYDMGRTDQIGRLQKYEESLPRDQKRHVYRGGR